MIKTKTYSRCLLKEWPTHFYDLLIFAAMRFGIKDICVVSFIGLLTGCYIIKISKHILDGMPFSDYLMGTVGLVAALFIILMVRPLIKQESAD